MRRFSIFTVACVSLLPLHATNAAEDWKKALEHTLETMVFERSSVVPLNGNRVTNEGTTLVVRRSGILGSPARHIGAVNTRIVDGEVVQPGGLAAFFATRDITQFSVGDVVYVTDVEVKENVVVLEILSREVLPVLAHGTTAPTRYKGEVEFHFAQGYLRNATVDDLRRHFSEFLASSSSNQ